MRRTFLTCALATVAAAMAPPVRAQASPYPTRPVHFIVPASAGGPGDVIARLFAEPLGRALGQPVIVDNKPGASLTLGTAAVAQAQPDGYTLLFTTSTPIVMVPFTMKKAPYDVQRDLMPVAHLGSTALVLYVNASSAIHDVKQLVTAARSQPQAANYGSYGNGSSAHVLGEMLNRQTQLSMVHVPYKGVAPELQDLVAGNLMAAVADIGTAAPLVKAGRIRPVAVTGTKRASALPDVPTFAEQGISGMEPFSPWWGVFAPAQTPQPIVNQLSVELSKLVRQPEMQARLFALGIDATGTTSSQAAEITRAEIAKWQSIIRSVSYINFE
ncbi:Tripartite-type tricarboxylate transporter, receptor component TctC [Variovorax sp. HW608]|uniref:Bug family tripartite tricarboxylate transporter substrate binding protein n=1 Tax=Variovorax sp. HW608 TaxID=1034889 RepID=UPI00081FE999|nr:tripartite tricarboxylate transporter substrate binding protein [Variovorax sp. HW608]SCK10455.1 Tripartite-type tricarboxylate transporter, receptor component TctC [Variovorax sp. HW608]